MEYVLASLWKLNVLYSRSLRCYAGACVVALLVVGFLLVVFGGVWSLCQALVDDDGVCVYGHYFIFSWTPSIHPPIFF